MAVYTNTLRFTGLSGIDTESMITALMKAEGMKLDKLKQQNQLTLWKQTAYYNVADIFRTFQNNFLALSSANSARLSSTFLRNTNTVKTTANTDSSAVRITNSANADIGKYTIDVKQLATKDTYTSAPSSASGNITSAADWTNTDVYKNLKAGDSITISLDGMSRNLVFTESNITDLQNKADSDSTGAAAAALFEEMLQDKLNAAFGQERIGNSTTDTPKVYAAINNGKLSITAAQGHTAIIQGGTVRDLSAPGTGAMDLSGLDWTGADEAGGKEFSLTVSQDGVNNTIKFMLKSDMSAAQAAAAINKGISDFNSAAGDDGPKITSGVKVTADNEGKFTIGVGSTTSSVSVSNAGSDILGALGFTGQPSVTIEPTNTLNDFGFTAGTSTKMDVTQTIGQRFDVKDDISFTINDRTFTFDSGAKIQDVMNAVNGANIGVKLSLDTLNESFRLESTNTGAANKMIIDDTDGFLANGLKLTQTEAQKAQDSRFIFNGIETTRDSNTVDISGIRMELTQITSDASNNPVNGGPVTIALEKDLSGTLDIVKNFVNAYNTMIDSLNTALNTNRPKKDSYNYYEPLTDDQKSAMKDTDIQNWDQQAQTGLLYNDDLLQGISSSLRSMLYQPVTLSNGTKMSLFEIGITTSNNIRDGGKLIIDENKLSQALETRGGDIAEFFTKSADIAYRPGVTDRNRIAQSGIAERMNDIINNAIGSSGSITLRAGVKGDALLEMSSTMYKTILDQNNRIADMLVYLQNKENDYYLMFSRMEQAVTAANNQMAYLQSQLAF